MDERIELVHALVDGELDAETRDQVTSWVASDPALNREYHWALAMKDAVAKGCPRIDSPASWEAAQKRLREFERVKTVNFLVGKHAWGLCGVLFIAILAAGSLNILKKNTTVSAVQAAEIFRAPWSASAPAAAPAKSSNLMIVNPIDGTGAFMPYTGLQLGATRLLQANGKPGIQYMLADNEGPMSLAIFKGLQGFEGVEEPVGYSDYKIGFINSQPSVTWQKGDSLMLLTADRDWNHLVETAKRLK